MYQMEKMMKFNMRNIERGVRDAWMYPRKRKRDRRIVMRLFKIFR